MKSKAQIIELLNIVQGGSRLVENQYSGFAINFYESSTGDIVIELLYSTIRIDVEKNYINITTTGNNFDFFKRDFEEYVECVKNTQTLLNLLI